MKILNRKEVQKFARKYLSDWVSDIEEVTMIHYGLTKTYFVNEHYLVIVKLFRAIHKDLQELA